MIAYFVIVSLTNLALGYGLAVYVARARSQVAAIETSIVTPARPVHAEPAVHPHAVEAERRLETRAETWTIDELPSGEPLPESADVAGVETELLAGLQEFRNQLSQLKGEVGLPESPVSPVEPVATS